MLNLFINVEGTAIFAILSLLIHEHGCLSTYLDLFFNNMLQFSEQKYHSLKFIPKCLILFNATVNGAVFL